MASRKKQLARLRTELYKNSSSMKKASSAKPDDSMRTWGALAHRCVVYGTKMAHLAVSAFDEVQRRWYPPKKGLNHPCSVDAIHMDQKTGLLYAIEFKIGQVETANLIRKIHETIMGCKENLGQISSRFSSYDFYREKMVYIVVASELEERNSKEMTFYRTYNAYDAPWDQAGFPFRWALKPLEGILVARVYELSPTMFSRFVKVKKWL